MADPFIGCLVDWRFFVHRVAGGKNLQDRNFDVWKEGDLPGDDQMGEVLELRITNCGLQIYDCGFSIFRLKLPKIFFRKFRPLQTLQDILHPEILTIYHSC